MALNTGKGYRRGAVAQRSQAYNPKTDKFVKRDANTGKFLSCKDAPFKGVVKEKTAKTKVNKKKSNSK